jgi:dissimilatory sulfite reductase (desulfoviridin) alpha/beta subunit
MLYEETKKMNTDDIIKNVNSNAKKIAQKFGINIIKTTQTQSAEIFGVSEGVLLKKKKR